LLSLRALAPAPALWDAPFAIPSGWQKFDLSAVALAKADQSKQLNYAKRTQFLKKSNVYNRSFDNELQRKSSRGHLVKTNPIKPNLVHLRWTCLPPADLKASRAVFGQFKAKNFAKICKIYLTLSNK
jgi:hypothetical protein